MTISKRSTRLAQLAGCTVIAAVAGLALGHGDDASKQAPLTDDVSWGPFAPDELEVWQGDDGVITAGDEVFESWSEYFNSDLFRLHAKRCGTELPILPQEGGSAGDCSIGQTDPDPTYDPSGVTYRIPVVVHVLRTSAGTIGNLSLAQVESQIQILNEDFRAIAGSNGQLGTDCNIEFFLATEDPSGDPTTGVTYSNNTTWYNDSGNYWTSLHWDTTRYLNIYTNTASGNLGYVPGFPAQGGLVGSSSDRVVCHWQYFGDNAVGGPPYDQGRTATHEVGHYLGLFHTFQGGCGSASCNTTGDLICDTNHQSNPTFGCSNSPTCGTDDPFRNYMDYSNDLCMNNFTPEQALRMRCTLEWWRTALPEVEQVPGACCVAQGCPGDVDGDGMTGFVDLVFVLSEWGCTNDCTFPHYDVDGSGEVDFGDVVAILGDWGPCPGPVCSQATQSECSSMGGSYLGGGVPCDGGGACD